eukprot:scaffold5430_cov18-Tisochrysis_lutea.AAC.1
MTLQGTLHPGQGEHPPTKRGATLDDKGSVLPEQPLVLASQQKAGQRGRRGANAAPPATVSK